MGKKIETNKSMREHSMRIPLTADLLSLVCDKGIFRITDVLYFRIIRFSVFRETQAPQ